MKNNKSIAKSKKSSVKQTPISNQNFKSKVSYLFGQTLWKQRSYIGRFMILIVYIASIIVASAYGISRWYQIEHKEEPLKFGATFIPNYAEYYKLDAKETLRASIDDLGIKRYRLVSYWKDYETEPDKYDFTKLDWQFDMIESAGGEISLALGLRQPRWPECHGPDWAMAKTVPEWTEDLKEFMGVVIDRYKDRDVLKEYQLENEYFLSVFGICPDFSRERLIDEYNYVKSKDSVKPVIISRSNNAVGFPIGDPQPDKFALTVYKRVWDKTLTKRYFEYPFPPWFYGFLAGGGEILTGKQLFIHELQTEAWLPDLIRKDGFSMIDAPIDELYKSMSPETLEDRMKYGVDTGMRTIDLWGIEWWYQMKTKRDAPELWQTAKTELTKYR